MSFQLPKFVSVDFSQSFFASSPDVKTNEVKKDGVAPKGFLITSISPEYFKVKGEWILPTQTSIECAAVVRDNNTVEIVEFRNLKAHDKVVLGKCTDGSEGIYKYTNGFYNLPNVGLGRSVESSFSKDYEELYELLEYEKENKGHILWVLGPAVVFDYDTRAALSELAENGYVNALMAGNAMATHDLEGGLLGTALGQNIYTQESVPMGHYNHLDLINEARRAGSIEALLNEGNIKDGFMKTCIEQNIPVVLVGSIRDDGPLPPVYHNVSCGLDAMKEQTDKATVIICLATVLHSVATANLASSYRVCDGHVRPVYFYSVDIAEYAVNQVAVAREYVGVKTIVTNVQDFVVNLQKNLR
ncbi:ornithine cyclodeaminase family domain [Clostridium sp.]